MSVEAVTWVDDLNTSNPLSTDPVSQGDDHLRNLKTGLKTTFPNATKAFYFPTTEAVDDGDSPVAVQAADQNRLFLADATAGVISVTPDSAITLGAGFEFTVKKIDSSANDVTIDANGTQTIDGELTLVLETENESVTLRSDGANWKIVSSVGLNEDTFLTSSDIGVTVQGYDADTLKADTADVLTAGFAATVFNAGTKSSGTFTPNEASGNFQRAVNGGAHTLAPPTNDCTILIQYTNNGSAGTITTSGFTMVAGDDLTTTDGHDFLFFVTKINGFSFLNVIALQ